MSPGRVTGDAPGVISVMVLAGGRHRAEGPDADKGVTADSLAAFDGFEQEGLGFVGGDA